MKGGIPAAPRWSWTSLRSRMLLGHLLEFPVPAGTELADQGLLYEPVDRYLEFLPQTTGRIADFPSVVIDRGELRILPEADGVQMAGNGLFPIDGTRFMG